MTHAERQQVRPREKLLEQCYLKLSKLAKPLALERLVPDVATTSPLTEEELALVQDLVLQARAQQGS